MKILKFGGKSASNQGINNIIQIIEDKIHTGEHITIVLSARGNTTNQLEEILELARLSSPYKEELNNIINYQSEAFPDLDLSKEFNLLESSLHAISLLGDYSLRVKDLIMAQGEIMAVKTLAAILNSKGIKAKAVDSRDFLKTDSNYGDARLIKDVSEKLTRKYFTDLSSDTIAVVTGFVASDAEAHTTTLGRNGSNYTASILADFLNAEIVESYTDVDGVFTANPKYVNDAKSIDVLSFDDANEMAGLGATILHPKTIHPLEGKGIPLIIKNTFNPDFKGTLIRQNNIQNTVKSITVKEDVCLILIEGKGLLGKKGIDARIFQTLYNLNISIGLISQGSSERSIGFLIDKSFSHEVITALKNTFETELIHNDINSIHAVSDVSLVSIIGINVNGFGTAFQNLRKNNIDIELINNTIGGRNVGLVIKKNLVVKALNIIHSQIFGVSRKVNIAIIGKGNVGSSLINQILKSKENIANRRELDLNIFAVAGSKKLLLKKNGMNESWKEDYEKQNESKDITDKIIAFAQKHHLENLIAIDNTASIEFTDNYFQFIENGFDVVSSNKIANTRDLTFYRKLRSTLKKFNKQYLYETNVGAGLPLIDTINLLHASGENINCIKGVFSGSLSYIFNKFSTENEKFSSILQEAVVGGFTEPDPREDLSGNDVARKLLILARELDLENEMQDVKLESLVSEDFESLSADEFNSSYHKLDLKFSEIKSQLKTGYVLRYVAKLHGDLQRNKGLLDVGLEQVSVKESLGNISGSDSIFEIYTDTYGDKPIIIQGAGAGAEVTARGVFGDILRIAHKIK